jgi:hypothetical protein
MKFGNIAAGMTLYGRGRNKENNMRSLLKYGVSVLALTVGIGAANAQDQKRPMEQGQVERPDSGSDQSQRQQGSDKVEKRQSNEAKQGQGDQRKERVGQGEDRQDTKQRMGQSEERKDRAGDRNETKERVGQSEDRKNRADDRNDNKERVGQSEDRKDDVKRSESDRKDGNKQAESSGKRHSKDKVKNVQITKEKKTVIRDRIFQRAPKRYTRNEVHFNLTVGTAIPRDVVIYDVPPTFVDIVPEFEGYDYIIVGDLVLIIDPDTREIVDIVDV